MGHDISLIKRKDECLFTVHRTAGSDSVRDFYEALSAQDYDGGLSGIGEKEFTKQELFNAKHYLESLTFPNEYRTEYIDFINHCLDSLKNDWERCLIRFW